MAPFGLGRQKSAVYLIAIVLTVFGSESNTSTESDKTLCYDRNNTAVPSGEKFIPVRGDPCRICLCDKGFAVMCSSVACYPPNNCYQPRLVPDTCCEYSCSPPAPTPSPGHNETVHPDLGNTDVSINSLGLRLAASAITSFLVLTLLLFMVHRLRRRRLLLSMRRHEAHTRCPHLEDCESDIFVDNMMAIPCPPYMDPPPPYSPPKPPHRIFPNEAPPPYEPFDTSARQSVQNSADTSTTSSSPAGTTEEGRPGMAGEGERPAPGTVNICSAREGVVTFTNSFVQEARQPDRAASGRRMEPLQRQAPSSQGGSVGMEEPPSRGTECGAAVSSERRNPLSRGSSMESPDRSSPSRRQRQGGRRRSHVDGRNSLVESSCSGESSLSNPPEGNSAQTVSSNASPREGRERECRSDARKKSSTRNSGSQDLARGGSRDRSKTKRNSVGSGQNQSVSQNVTPASGACSSSWHQGCSSWNESVPTMSQSAHEENAVCTCESSPPRLPPNPSGSQGNQQSLASLRLSALLGSDNGLEELENVPRASELPSGNELLPRSQSVNSEVSALSVCSETGETRRSRSTTLRNDLPYPEYPHGFQSSPTRRRLPQASAARSHRETAAVAAEETVSSGAGHQNGLEAQPGPSQIMGSPSGSSGKNADLPGQASSAGTSETMNPEQKKKKSRGKSSRHSTGSLPHVRTKGKTGGVWPCGSTSRHSGAALDSPSFSRANDKASPRKRDSPKKTDPAIKQYGYIDNPRAVRKQSVGSQWPSGIRQLLSPGECSQSPKKVKSTYSQSGTGVHPAGQPDPRQAALVLGLEAMQAAQSMSNARRQNKKRMSYPNTAGGVPITLERITPGDRAAVPSAASTRSRLAPETSAQSSVTDLSDRYPQLSAAERQGIQASYIHPSELPESFPSQLKVRGSYV